MSIGKNIKRARQARRWPQSYLAEKCGVTVQAVSQWETDKTTPSYARLNEIANILGVDLDWLAEADAVEAEEVPPSANRKAFGGRIPIISLEDASYFAPSVIQSKSAPNHRGYVDALTPFHEVAFAIRVENEEILRPLFKNDLIIFEVGLEPREGDIVVFNGILPGGVLSDITIGQVELPSDDDYPSKILVTALDEAHRIAEVSDNSAWSPYMIVGVAIELRRERSPPRPRWG